MREPARRARRRRAPRARDRRRARPARRLRPARRRHPHWARTSSSTSSAASSQPGCCSRPSTTCSRSATPSPGRPSRRAARPGEAPAAPRRPRRARRRARAATSPPSPTTPPAPATTSASSTPPGGAAQQYLERGLDLPGPPARRARPQRGRRRPEAARGGGPRRLAGRPDRRRRRPQPPPPRGRPPRRRPGGRVGGAAPPGPPRLGAGRLRHDGDGHRRGHRPARAAARGATSGAWRWPSWPSRRCSATTSPAAVAVGRPRPRPSPTASATTASAPTPWREGLGPGDDARAARRGRRRSWCKPPTSASSSATTSSSPGPCTTSCAPTPGPATPSFARRQLERMRAAAERVGFDSMAGSAHAQGLADLAEWEGDLDAAAGRARGRPPDRPGLPAHRAGRLVRRARGRPRPRGRRRRARRRHLRRSSPAATGTRSWFVGLGVPRRLPHAATSRPAPAGSSPTLVASSAAAVGAALVHDVVSAALQAGVGVHELRPLADRVASHPSGHTPPPTGEEARGQGARRGPAGRGRRRPSRPPCPSTRRPPAPRTRCSPTSGARPMSAPPAACIALGPARRGQGRGWPRPRRLLARWAGWRVEELEGGPPPARRRRAGRRPAGDRSRRASARSSPCSPRGSPTPSWPAACSSPRRRPPSTCRTCWPSSAWLARTEVAAWAIREGVAT